MPNNKLRDKILKASTLATTDILANQELLDFVPIVTSVPMVNVALSGSPLGGIQPGTLMIAGESKHFKTGFGLLMVSSFLSKYDDGVVLFYDSEFGHNDTYFALFGIDKERIIHCPITSVEEWKEDIANQIKGIERGDHVMIFVDSIGNLASLKEIVDAEEGKNTADLTRARQLNSTFRIVGPHLPLKGIPMVVINHTYKEIGTKYPRDIVSGGQKAYLNANDVWILGRNQDKTETEGLVGYNFVINIEKSRTVKEKSKIPINVSFEHGISKYSGLFDLAVELGLIVSPSKGRYEYNGVKGYRKDFDKPEHWEAMLQNQQF
ncbi:MAG TPA: recombinase RecA, partial [Methylomirabilota bacterium]|nr:recombinase RecA [Methylomirabilota bacterium]